MEFKLSLFGPPRLLDDHGNMIAVPAKTFSLIAYLLLTSRGEPATRASLRQFFWGSSDSKKAATNLSKFLWRLGERQQQIGFELVRIERNHVELAEPLEADRPGSLPEARLWRIPQICGALRRLPR